MPKKISSNFFDSSVSVATSLIVPQLPESATSILHELLRYLGKAFNFTKKASIGLYFTHVGCPEQAQKVLRSSFLYLWMGACSCRRGRRATPLAPSPPPMLPRAADLPSPSTSSSSTSSSSPASSSSLSSLRAPHVDTRVASRGCEKERDYVAIRAT
jgi:hypothetical protein